MRDELIMITILIGAIFMFWFGMLILNIGQEVYGEDASLLWVSGILTLMGINGVYNFVRYLWDLHDETKPSEKEKKQ